MTLDSIFTFLIMLFSYLIQAIRMMLKLYLAPNYISQFLLCTFPSNYSFVNVAPLLQLFHGKDFKRLRSMTTMHFFL